MRILVVGSVALDSIQTPFGKVREALGGSATFFSAAASLYAPVNLVAVVGTDFPQGEMAFLRERGVDFEGMQVVEGKTFRWAGRYDYDLNVAETLDTQLNVFAAFHPQIPPSYRASEFVFLANIDPVLQLEVLKQVENPCLTVLDTMNYWINYRKDALTEAMAAVDIVLLNEAETRQYVGTFNLVRAARRILELGPRAVVVKKGEYGATLFTNSDDLQSSYFFVPGYPLEVINDPTGAGDSFAGGFLGYLASACGREVSLEAIKRAIVHGSVVASFTVEAFGLEGLKDLTRRQIEDRYQEFRSFTRFEAEESDAGG